MAGAFYPNYFYCGQVDERSAVKEVGGLDILSSVVVSQERIGHYFYLLLALTCSLWGLFFRFKDFPLARATFSATSSLICLRDLERARGSSFRPPSTRCEYHTGPTVFHCKCSRAFIEFHRLPSESPKHVANAVYCALMMRCLTCVCHSKNATIVFLGS